jgi:hypothetical protein
MIPVYVRPWKLSTKKAAFPVKISSDLTALIVNNMLGGQFVQMVAAHRVGRGLFVHDSSLAFDHPISCRRHGFRALMISVFMPAQWRLPP